MLMATKRMLIDSTHPEETRVLVVSGNRLEDFDVEVQSRKRLKGNIYLAKVTRVEPSLQAAFVDYGGNRHGFLAFSEIHPDYYQIPVADREALIAEERAAAAKSSEIDESSEEEEGPIETLGGDDSDEFETRRPVINLRKNYKIQEVIKRRQILLIQVVKEERGTKGAALSTYLSLAGRYCVLMPNTDRRGGISRKIGSVTDRKKLRKIITDLGILEGMAVIIRTAGAQRSRAEIRRDYEYLLRLWNQIRELTLSSIAPSLVHGEGDLIKRSIRDLYTKDIDEIIVHGEEGYRSAKDFMKILIPSHAKKVQKYKKIELPLTLNYGIDDQLEAIHSSEVHLKSGGYIIINPTEALVAIDVNSGRATKERNIEETALKTNIEAAMEIARQLKLRDLAGLIVIDFIDMEVNRNQTRVERTLKEAMRSDRARIQIGRISPFGLLELSRQRLRPSLIETSSEPCPHCKGSGIRRSTETAAVEVLRAIEEEGMRKDREEVTIFVPTEVALYLLNRKRDALTEFEQRFKFKIFLENDDNLIPPDLRVEGSGEKTQSNKSEKTKLNNIEPENFEDVGNRKRKRRRSRRKIAADKDPVDLPDTDTEKKEIDAKHDDETEDGAEGADSNGVEAVPNKRRRRGRRGGRNRRKRSEENAVKSIDTVEKDLKENVSRDSTNRVINLEEQSNSKDEYEHKRLISYTSDTTDRAVTETIGENTINSGVKEKPKPRSRRRRTNKAPKSTPEIKNEIDVQNDRQTSPIADVNEVSKSMPASTNSKNAGQIVTVTGAAKTTVIEVGGDSQPSRSGWWDRD